MTDAAGHVDGAPDRSGAGQGAFVRRMMKSDRETPFFGSLPPSLMHAFVGSNRVLHEEVLVSLVTDLYSDGAGSASHAEVLQAIRNVISRRQFAPGEEPVVEGDADATSEYTVYGALSRADWFVETRRGGRRYVDIQPNARILLNFLIDMRNGMTSSWGGEVLKVLTLLETAERDPEERSENIRSAARSSTNFMHHLRSMTSMLAEIERDVLTRTESRHMVKAIFETFVGKYLIEDYSRLKSRTNPFHYRDRIVTCARGIRSDDGLMERLGAAYMTEGRVHHVADGIETVRRELETVVSVFTGMDDTVRVVDEASHRLERKFINMIRFRDRYDDARIDNVISLLSALARDGRPGDEVIPVSMSLPRDMETMAPDRARRERTRVTRPRQVVEEEREDPAFLRYMQELMEFQAIVDVTDKDALDFLDRRMEGRTVAGLGDFEVATLEEALVFSQLQRVFARNDDRLGRYRCRPLETMAGNEWMSITDLEITDAEASRLELVG